MNTIDALNIFYREDVISDLLKSCFEDSPAFLKQFLEAGDVALNTHAEYTIMNRLGLGKTIGTPDMVIVNGNQIIVIENKLGTGEGMLKTMRYESNEAKEGLLKKFRMEAATFHYIFLTLDTTVMPSSSNFKHLYYSEFLAQDWLLQDSTLHMIFKDFQEKLHEFYAPLRTPLETLATDYALDSTQKKICWQQLLFDQFSVHPTFTLDWGEVGGTGRNNFLFLITKSNWKATAPFDKAGLSKTFYVHIDTYINLLSSSNDSLNEIGVRFETNPYVPHAKIKNDPQYAKFIEHKQLFAERLYELVKESLPTSKKRNTKLLSLSIPIDKSSLEKSIDNYTQKVLMLEKMIDRTIENMKEDNIL